MYIFTLVKNEIKRAFFSLTAQRAKDPLSPSDFQTCGSGLMTRLAASAGVDGLALKM